jgi:ketosteroid isomerase-like protein
VTVVRAVFAAFAERDVERVLDLIDPEVEFTPVTADFARRTEPYRGHEGIREYFRDVALIWEDLRLTPRAFRKMGDSILVTGRVNARSAARIVDGSTGWVWRVRDGRVVYGRVYPSAADAVRAAEAERAAGAGEAASKAERAAGAGEAASKTEQAAGAGEAASKAERAAGAGEAASKAGAGP